MRIVIGLFCSFFIVPWSASAAEPAAIVINELDDCLLALEKRVRSIETPLPEVLRIGSWNIMKEQREGAEAFYYHLLSEADVFLTQEAVQRDEMTTRRYFAPGYRRGDLQTGVATSSVFQADVICALSFNEPWLRTPKAVLATRFPTTENALLVVNLHAINFTLGSKAYGEQLEAISRMVQTHEGPVVVGGDLNNWNPWRQRVLTEFAAEAGLARVTFSPDWRSRHLGTPIDSALVRGLRVVSAAALPTTLSDHHPILVLLTAPSNPPEDIPAASGQRTPGH